MWDQGGQPWPQWPMNQQQWMQSFQHQQDPSQVDWAALAQAWIAQKESTGPTVDQQNIHPNGQDIPGMDPVMPNNHGSFQGDTNFGRMWQPEWGMHGQPPPPPIDQAWIPPGTGPMGTGPMDVVAPSEDSNSQDSLEFSEGHHRVFPQNSHGFGGQPDNYAMNPMAINQFDYQHGAAATYGPTPTGFHPPYWQQGHPQNRRDRPPGFRDRQRSPIQIPKQDAPAAALAFPGTQENRHTHTASNDLALLSDAVKRRTLPAWIREGLEKMDREKQKKLEKERMEKQRAEMAKDEDKESDTVDEGGDGPRLPRKSKFDSDDEEGDEEEREDEDRVLTRKQELASRSPSPPLEDQSEPEMTEEEREFQLMIVTKTLLTEILLEVTNEEIQTVAKETHRKATKGLLTPISSRPRIICAFHKDIMFKPVLYSLKTSLNSSP
ncbi:unnamed protein product [Oncorhynchus mykiss]|uniref:Arginine/serine-rich protein PNISR n=1 Tax=Oncorhynchus mykiss TaxID=8022 RepID=A0A060X9G0_ONCMY|nr:unnamed protein product [Oncorhynchus mykiss]